MRDFVTSNLRINEGAFVPLGAKEIPSANTLYYSYINFCKKTGYEACSHIKFSRNLLDTLRMLHIPSSKKRREGGQSIIGVSLKEGKEIKSTDQSFLESLREKTRRKRFFLNKINHLTLSKKATVTSLLGIINRKGQFKFQFIDLEPPPLINCYFNYVDRALLWTFSHRGHRDGANPA